MNATLLSVLLAVAPPAPPVLPPITASGAARPSIATGFAVEITGDGRLLWQGTMRTSARYVASASLEQRDAPASTCSVDDRDYLSYQSGNSVRATIATIGFSDNRPATFRVEVTWVHPSGQASCGTGSGSRTVAVTQVFDGSQPDVVVDGDGGLRVRIRRRQLP